MIPLEECVAVLLCAGLSQRFGQGNKLLAPLSGQPLAAHAAALCMRVPLTGRIPVVPRVEPALRALLLEFGFDPVVNPDPAAGKDGSLRIGLARALGLRARGALVLLGDMPHVDLLVLQALATVADDETAAICINNGISSPPALIPAKAMRKAIDAVDQPVRASLGPLAYVAAPASTLVDYDRPEQFCAAGAAEGNPPYPPSLDEDDACTAAHSFFANQADANMLDNKCHKARVATSTGERRL